MTAYELLCLERQIVELDTHLKSFLNESNDASLFSSPQNAYYQEIQNQLIDLISKRTLNTENLDKDVLYKHFFQGCKNLLDAFKRQIKLRQQESKSTHLPIKTS